MVQYQVTTVLNNEEDLERFVIGQRLAKDEAKRMAWEKHFREAEKKLEGLKAEIDRLSQDKAELERKLSHEEEPKQLPTEKLTGEVHPDKDLTIPGSKNS